MRAARLCFQSHAAARRAISPESFAWAGAEIGDIACPTRYTGGAAEAVWGREA
jgi:hypothetical protein